MTIPGSALQLLPAQDLTQFDTGGGRVTSTPLVDNTVGALLAQVPRTARAGGQADLVKVALGIATANTDQLAGSGLFLTSGATDSHVSTVLFSTGASAHYDTRVAARQYLENYVVAGPEYQGYLYGPHVAGALAMTVLQRPERALPEIGAVFALQVGGSVVQYARVSDVSSAVQTFSDSQGDWQMRVVTLTLGTRLAQNYSGGTPGRYSTHNSPTLILTTTVAAAAKFYGVSRLAAAASSGSLQVIVDSVFAQAVPSATRQTAVTDATPGGALAAVAARVAYHEISQATGGSVGVGQTYTIVLPRAAIPGSVSIRYGYSYDSAAISRRWVDTGAGSAVVSGASGWTIDYAAAVLKMTSDFNDGGGGGLAWWVRYTPAGITSQTAHTLDIPVTLGTRSQVYAPTVDPLPAPKSVSISYRALGRWYVLRDDGAGTLVPDLSGTGTGTVSYTTGAMTITLGALPDIGSSVLIQWGSPTHYVLHASDTIAAAEIRVQLPHQGLKKGTVTVAWTQSGAAKSVTDNSAGGWTGSAAAGGSCDYVGGLVRVIPAALPDVGTLVTVTYQQAIPLAGTAGGTRVGSTISGSFGVPLRPGTLRMSVTANAGLVLTKPGYEDKPVSAAVEIVIGDNGSGALTAVSGDGLASGTIDYATGAWSVTLSGSVSRSVYGHTHWGTYSLTIDPASAVCGAFTVEGSGSAYTSQTYSVALSGLTLDFAPTHAQPLVPGSLLYTWGGQTWIDRSGTLYYAVSTSTGSGTVGGTLDYTTGLATLTVWTAGGANSVGLQALLTQLGTWTMIAAQFRAPGAPLLPASLYLQATRADGTLMTVTAAADGTISGDGVRGTVNVATGVVRVEFASVGATQYRPIIPGTLRFSCVVVATVPQDASLIGVDATRLPSDGRVPIYRAGGDELVLIHETVLWTMPSGLTAGQVVSLPDADLQALELRDAADVQVPATLYTADLLAGTVTMATPLSLSGYAQPLVARMLVGDLVSVSDVLIDGTLTLGSALTRDYTTAARVSSMLRGGNLRARVSVLFDQASWDGVTWQDAVSGSVATATFDSVTYPPQVRNDSSRRERWALKFTSATGGQIIGETFGVVGAGFTTTANVVITNPFTGQPDLVLDWHGFGSGWAAGNIIRINVESAQLPAWLLRCTSPGAQALATDRVQILAYGDA